MIHRKGFLLFFYFKNTLKWFFSFTLNNKLKIKYENKRDILLGKIKIKIFKKFSLTINSV